MTWQIATTLGVLVTTVLGLCLLNIGPDLVLLGGLTILLLTGVVDTEDALSGFGNEGLVTVAVLYAVAEGLRQTGGISAFGQRLLGQPKTVISAQSRVMFPTAIASAFLNNTPVVAMMMPLLHDWARKHSMSVSRLLLPLSYAAILGGMCTLIGTSTTLVLDGKLIEARGQGLSMFEIAFVGVPASIAGLIYLLVCGRWLLPDRRPAITEHDDPREYAVEMIVDPKGPLVGKTIEAAGLRHLSDMYLFEIDRPGEIKPAVGPTEKLQADDRLVFVGVVESVIDLQKIAGLKPAHDHQFQLDEPRNTRRLIEAVVSSRCPFIGLTIRDAKFRGHYNAAVLAVARDGKRVNKKIGDIELVAGDTLLLEAHPSFIQRQRNSRDFYLVSELQGSKPLNHDRAWIARLILAVMVVVVGFGIFSMLEASLLAAGLMVATRCCRGAEAKRAIDWSVLLVIGAGLGIGEAMKSSGTAELIANLLISGLEIGFENLGKTVAEYPRVALAVIYLITTLLTNLITAKAAAVLVFPIAMATADQINTDITPFAITVMVAAAASFATPIGYQTNLMVYGPGGYRYRDYLQLGVPLTAIVWLVTVIVVPLRWGF